jgi:hypothetical protein
VRLYKQQRTFVWQNRWQGSPADAKDWTGSWPLSTERLGTPPHTIFELTYNPTPPFLEAFCFAS